MTKAVPGSGMTWQSILARSAGAKTGFVSNYGLQVDREPVLEADDVPVGTPIVPHHAPRAASKAQPPGRGRYYRLQGSYQGFLLLVELETALYKILVFARARNDPSIKIFSRQGIGIACQPNDLALARNGSWEYSSPTPQISRGQQNGSPARGCNHQWHTGKDGEKYSEKDSEKNSEKCKRCRNSKPRHGQEETRKSLPFRVKPAGWIKHYAIIPRVKGGTSREPFLTSAKTAVPRTNPCCPGERLRYENYSQPSLLLPEPETGSKATTTLHVTVMLQGRLLTRHSARGSRHCKDYVQHLCSCWSQKGFSIP
jgi:hypothetical protein